MTVIRFHRDLYCVPQNYSTRGSSLRARSQLPTTNAILRSHLLRRWSKSINWFRLNKSKPDRFYLCLLTSYTSYTHSTSLLVAGLISKYCLFAEYPEQFLRVLLYFLLPSKKLSRKTSALLKNARYLLLSLFASPLTFDPRAIRWNSTHSSPTPATSAALLRWSFCLAIWERMPRVYLRVSGFPIGRLMVAKMLPRETTIDLPSTGFWAFVKVGWSLLRYMGAASRIMMWWFGWVEQIEHKNITIIY